MACADGAEDRARGRRRLAEAIVPPALRCAARQGQATRITPAAVDGPEDLTRGRRRLSPGIAPPALRCAARQGQATRVCLAAADGSQETALNYVGGCEGQTARCPHEPERSSHDSGYLATQLFVEPADWS